MTLENNGRGGGGGGGGDFFSSPPHPDSHPAAAARRTTTDADRVMDPEVALYKELWHACAGPLVTVPYKELWHACAVQVAFSTSLRDTSSRWRLPPIKLLTSRCLSTIFHERFSTEFLRSN